MATEDRRKKDRQTPSQARAARRARRQRRKRFTKLAALSAVASIAILFIFSLFAGSLPITLGSKDGPDGPGDRITSQGRTHINRTESHPPYSTVPATSGWHFDDYSAPARWDIYGESLPDEVLVHNLEHGGVGIHYDCPDGCDDLIAKLEEVASRATKVIMSPYPNLGSKIALTAWTFIDKFDEFDEERIEAFVNAHVSSPNAPEYLQR